MALGLAHRWRPLDTRRLAHPSHDHLQVLQLRFTCCLLLLAGLSYLAVPASRAALLASVQGSEAARRSSGGVVLPLRISSYGRSATTAHITIPLASPYTDRFPLY